MRGRVSLSKSLVSFTILLFMASNSCVLTFHGSCTFQCAERRRDGYIYIHVYVHICMYMYIHVCVHIWCVVCVCAYLTWVVYLVCHIYMFVCMHVHILILMYMYVCMHVCGCVYTHIRWVLCKAASWWLFPSSLSEAICRNMDRACLQKRRRSRQKSKMHSHA